MEGLGLVSFFGGRGAGHMLLCCTVLIPSDVQCHQTQCLQELWVGDLKRTPALKFFSCLKEPSLLTTNIPLFHLLLLLLFPQ